MTLIHNKWLPLIAGGLMIGTVSTTQAADGVSLAGGGLKVTADGFSFKINGRAQFDALSVLDDDDNHARSEHISSGTDIRRAYISFKGNAGKDWKYKFQYDFAGQVMKETYVAYTGISNSDVLIGAFSPAMFLTSYSSSKWATFIERSIVDNFALDYEQGIGFNTHGNNYSLYTSITADHPDNDEVDDANGDPEDDQYSVAARINFAPMHEQGNVLHFGATIAIEDVDGSTTFGARPASKVDGGQKLISGGVADSSEVTILGVEAAAVMGPFSIQSEYVSAKIDARTGSDADYSAFYVLGSFFITGESRSYYVDGGVFDRPTIGSSGAWEVAAKIEVMDLSDTDDGELTNAVLALNYYANKNVRFGLNYIQSSFDADTGGTDRDVDLLQLRTQFVF